MKDAAVRSARPSRMRWAYGAVLAVCAALVVLVHHETAAFTVSSMPMAPSTRVAAPEMAHGSASAAHGHTRADSPDNRAAAAMVHRDGEGACGAMGGQHCSTASLSTLSLAPPPSGAGSSIAQPPPVVGSALPPRTIGRAPPDLSVLSCLRT